MTALTISRMSLFERLLGWGTVRADRGGAGRPHLIDSTSGIIRNPSPEWAEEPDTMRKLLDSIGCLATNFSFHDLQSDLANNFVETTTATSPIAVWVEETAKYTANVARRVNLEYELIDEKLLRKPQSLSSVSAGISYVSPKPRLKDDEELIW